MGDSCEKIRFKPFGDPDSDLPVGIIIYLCEAGKAGRFCHYVENQFDQWDKLCALEDALVDTHNEEGFLFVVGSRMDDPEVKGWLEYEDVIILPLGAKGQSKGRDVSVYSRECFDDGAYVIHAFSECADDSGIKLNKIVRAIHGKPISPSGVVG